MMKLWHDDIQAPEHVGNAPDFLVG